MLSFKEEFLPEDAEFAIEAVDELAKDEAEVDRFSDGSTEVWRDLAKYLLTKLSLSSLNRLYL